MTRLVATKIGGTWWTKLVASVSLLVVFAATLFYLVFIPLLIWGLWEKSVACLFIIIIGLISSLVATKPWGLIKKSYIFASWRHYFEFEVIRECNLSVDDKLLFAALPHGLFPVGLPMAAGLSEQILQYDNLSTAVASNLFNVPFISPLLTWLGCIPATREKIIDTLEREKRCLIMPDGIMGAFCSNKDEEIVYLEQRKGFVKVALQTGASIVPIYCFGHTQLFDVYSNGLLVGMSRFIQFSIIFYWPIVPRKRKITMVIGSPLIVEKVSEPTDEQINVVHSTFKERVVQLFDIHKASYGWKDKLIKIL